MVLLAVLSGLRHGEIFGLRWKYVDFEEGSVIVAESSYEGHASAPKTRASRRKVFVDTPAIEALSLARPTWANPSGESIKALQAQLGHTDSRLTLSVYTQPMSEAQKLLACKISSVLLRSAPKSEVQRAEAEVVIP
jgi:hypothetical protein